MTVGKRVILSLMVLLIGLQLCGFAPFNNAEVDIDTEKNKVYKYVTVDTIVNDFNSDVKCATESYNNGFYLVTGTIESISKKGDSITIYGSEKNSTIACSCGKEVRDNIISYKTGDKVALYGQVSVDVFDKDLHLKVEKIIEAPKDIKSSVFYYTLAGNTFDYSKSSLRTLAGGRIEYRIPFNWNEIELDIRENGLGTIEGYQYVLDRLPGNESEIPEAFFVCYFDKNLLKNKSDINNIKEVEKAIISNIDGNVDRFPMKAVTTYYNQKYKYYKGKFEHEFELDSNGYRTEYIFLDDGNNGVVMFLYVSRDGEPIDDIFFVTRFLKIKK